MRVLLFSVCFGLLLAVASAAFSAQLTNTGANLAFGSNSVNLNNGAWTTNTNANSGWNDGQFQPNGGYVIPVPGVYHFDATLNIQVSSSTPPDQTADIRIVKCGNGCNSLCTPSPQGSATLVSSGTQFLSTGTNGIAFAPTYALSASFTGAFSTGDIVGVCVDSSATSNAVRLQCSSVTPDCTFSGFSL